MIVMLEKLRTNKSRGKRIPDKERGLLQNLKTASKHNTVLYRISQELIDKTVVYDSVITDIIRNKQL